MTSKYTVRLRGRVVEIIPKAVTKRKKPRTKKENFRDWLSRKLIKETLKDWFEIHKKEYSPKHFKMLGASRHLIKIFERNFPDTFRNCFIIWNDEKYNELDDLFLAFKDTLEIKLRHIPKYKKSLVVSFNLPILKEKLENKYFSS